MKVLLFVMLAGYAVRCDENNYYVIEMVDDPPIRKPFKVYWNVPTKQCKSKKIRFDNLYEKFGIIQNENDYFQGERVTILYDPGLFPALLKNETSGRFKFRNGGVPQEGDLSKHLEAFKHELDESIPDKNFDGIGIIDFESWRPVYRQNFGVLRPYKDVSYEIERKLHWWWQKTWLEAEAKRRFEDSARTFMQATIVLAKELRPRAEWGFYGFPYCFNMASNNMVEACASHVSAENDDISWLWRESTALFPSVYSSAELSTAQMTSLIRGRVREASRFGRRILPYFWYRYRDASFLSQVDLSAALDTLYKSNASGFIIWGSSNDVNTVQKCNKLLNYIENVMGPAIAKYTNPPTNLNDEERTTDIDDFTTTIYPNRIKELDPEYHWIPPENYTQDIKNNVAEEIIKKLTNYTENGNNGLGNNNILMDLILNSVISKEYNVSNVNTTVIENNSSNELLSSSTTKINLENETTTNTVTSSIESIVEEDIDTTSTETTLLTQITDSSYQTTQPYIYDDTIGLFTTVSSDMITDFTMSKNDKKTSLQDTSEEYFDVTTEANTDTKETTDLRYSTTDITTHLAKYNEYTTDINFAGKEEISTEATITKSPITEAINSNENLSLNTLTRVQFYSTDKPDFTVSDVTDVTSNTKTQDLEYNSTMKDDLSFKSTEFNNNIGIDNNLSTKQPELKENTEFDGNSSTKSPDLKATEMEEDNIKETSLMPTTTAPEQVVVYV